MKLRVDFVTNSSSCSYVVCKSDFPEDQREQMTDEILMRCDRWTRDGLLKALRDYSWSSSNIEVYNLVDYEPTDDEMHLWIRRDESMFDDAVDQILYEYDRTPAWDSHMSDGLLVQHLPAINPRLEYHY